MLLRALYDFYQRACNDSNIDIEDPAFERTNKVRWVVSLDSNGDLEGVGMDDLSHNEEGRDFSAPRTSRPKGSGRVAEFLCDGLEGVFGGIENPEEIVSNEKKRKREDENRKAKHEDFWSQIEMAWSETKQPDLGSVLRFRERHLSATPFFLRWGKSQSPKQAEKPSWWIRDALGKEARFKNGEKFTFRMNGDYLIENETVRRFWRRVYEAEQEAKEKEKGAVKGACLVTGKLDVPIPKSHLPRIKKLPGSKQSELYLVSAYEDATWSYGLEQSLNAHVSAEAVTAYCNALNWLIKQRSHTLRISNAAVICFWAKESEEVSARIKNLFDRPTAQAVRNFLNTPWRGESDAAAFDEHEQFYSVTLSGNAGRVVVRHWMQTTVKQALDNFRNWFEDLNVVKFRPLFEIEAAPPLSIFRLAATTVRDEKDVRPELPTQLYRAALEGHKPSLTIAQQILRRLQTDLCKFGDDILETPLSAATERRIREASHPVPPPGESRMALLRLIINRNRKEGETMIEPAITETDNRAYNCGRLFAVLDDLQREALATKKQKDGKDYWQKFDGAGVIERFYGSASANPSIAFPYLLRLHQHHLKKLAQIERTWLQEKFKKKIEEISSAFTAREFPKTLNLLGQGRFALGFYQQKAADRAERQSYLDSKKNKPDASHDNMKGESTDE